MGVDRRSHSHERREERGGIPESKDQQSEILPDFHSIEDGTLVGYSRDILPLAA